MGKIFEALGLGAAATVLGGFVVAILGIVAIFLFSIIGAFMGAVAGFILELTPVLGALVKEGFMLFGVENPSLVAIGAMLGFVAGFFKSANAGGQPCKG